jgi:hypothetical protein
VVVGEPPPTHVGIQVLPSHLGDSPDVAGVLGDQRDDAGQRQQDEAELELRRVERR